MLGFARTRVLIKKMPASLPTINRAWLASAYGGPEVLALRSLPLIAPRGRQLLIRVQATTVSAADRRIRQMDFPRGMRLMGRAIFGARRPRRPVLGAEFTGVVAAVGPQVTRFAPGDAVIAFAGARGGGHGEYATLRENDLVVSRPDGMSLQVAAALSFGGTTARSFLRRGDLKAGERVLIIGASGTVGSALVQLANDAGAQVTGVTSAENIDLVRSLGANAVIDYTTRDVTREAMEYDIVADAVGALTFAQALPILAEGGRFLAINGGVGDMLARPRHGRRCIAGPAAARVEDLTAISALCTEMRFRPLIDSILPFDNLPRGHARVDTGRKRGSVVVMLPTGQ